MCGERRWAHHPRLWRALLGAVGRFEVVEPIDDAAPRAGGQEHARGIASRLVVEREAIAVDLATKRRKLDHDLGAIIAIVDELGRARVQPRAARVAALAAVAARNAADAARDATVAARDATADACDPAAWDGRATALASAGARRATGATNAAFEAPAARHRATEAQRQPKNANTTHGLSLSRP